METKRFEKNKLVRDKVIRVFDRDNIKYTFHVLPDREFQKELGKKLIEETHELLLAKERTEILEELADVEAVLGAFKEFLHITSTEMEAALKQKSARMGDFNERIFLEYIDIPLSDTRRIAYCEKKEQETSVLKCLQPNRQKDT